MTLPLISIAFVSLVSYGLYRLSKFVYAELTSPLRDLPGPPSASLIYGNFKQIWEAENSVVHEQWVREYGSTLTYKGFLGISRLYTTDTKALNHVLMNNSIYQKPEMARYNLTRILGSGVLVVEDEKHKQQRKIMNPAFGAAQIRELTEIFVQKSLQLRDIWTAEAAKADDNVGRVDVLSWLSRMTLDVIGLAGFNYSFNALNNDTKPNELNDAFSTVFRAETKISLVAMLKGLFPIFRFLSEERDKKTAQAKTTMMRIGSELLADSKASVYDDKKLNSNSSVKSRDLLSLLVRANLETDGPRMEDEDVLAQVPTFLVAGHETTSTGTTWALFALTQAPHIQTKLREELLQVPTDNPTMDELNALPYLDAVVRETLRVHAPVPSTIRVAVKDDVLPIGKPFTDLKGRVRDSVVVRKGQTLLVPILAVNRDVSLWGEDASEFKPERWEHIPESAGSIPGVWGNMLSFLGGPRACIGYRFSLVEMKALLFTLIRAFEFELAVKPEEIGKKSSIVQRPVLLADPERSNQMPLLLKPVPRG